MASLRKKYQQSYVESPGKDEPPVLPPPATGAKMPEPATDAGPPELPETKSPADHAAESALRKRLQEMERAEALQDNRRSSRNTLLSRRLSRKSQRIRWRNCRRVCAAGIK